MRMDRALKITRRSLLAVPLALPLAGQAFAADAPLLPILPFNTDFSFWDHYWFQPLAGHSLYESIEAALATGGGAPLIRVWLTEKGSKRQALYSNEAGVPGAGQADIQLTRSGSAGAPQGLSLSFADSKGATVKWDARFGSGGAAEAALKGQFVADALSFWYANAGTTTTDASITIGGAPFGPGNTSYSPGAYGAALLFGSSQVAPSADGFTTGSRSFTRSNGRYIARFETLGQPASIELRCAADNALLAYRQSQGRHVLALDFDGALAAQGKAVGFDLEFDNRDIASGTVTPVSGPALRWDFAEPDWAKRTSLRTAITPRADGGYSAQVSPIR
jgi:hypothetical protein